VQYVNPRDLSRAFVLPDELGEWEKAGDLGPEGLVFVSEDESPNGAPLLIVANGSAAPRPSTRSAERQATELAAL